MWFFRLLCHQIPLRSPEFHGTQFPVCFRCAGLYGGMLFGYVFLAIRGGLSRSFPTKKLALLAATLTFAYPLDGCANALHFWNSPGWLRSLTGLSAGIATSVLLLPLASGFGLRRLSSLPEARALVWPFCSGLGFIAMLSHLTSQIEFELLAFACALGLGCFVTNLLFSCMRRDHADADSLGHVAGR